MCRCLRIFNNISLEKCSKISLAFNLIIILLNILIIFFTLLCLIQDKYEIMLKPEVLSCVNNILFCCLMIIGMIFIEYYRFTGSLIQRKIKSSIIFLSACTFISIIKFIDIFDSITNLNRFMLLFRRNKRTIPNEHNHQLNKEVNKEKRYLMIISILLVLLAIDYIIYIISLFNMEILYYSINLNAQNDPKIIDASTEVDINIDNNDNFLNNLNADRIRYTYYLSQNIVYKLEKDFKDESTQTIN